MRRDTAAVLLMVAACLGVFAIYAILFYLIF
jgi:hypothetical protein